MSGVCKKASAYLSHGANTTKNCIESEGCELSDTDNSNKATLKVCKKKDGGVRKYEIYGKFEHLGTSDEPHWGSVFGWKTSSTK
jgi:hypothetical protein